MDKIVVYFRHLLKEHFFGTVVFHFQNGKITHVEQVKTENVWRYKDLPA